MVRAVLLASALAAAAPAAFAAPAYIALGDSVTFGETDLRYIPSLGLRGYVDDFAAARGIGIVRNFAIDGETADSFRDATGRTPPVVGRTDVPLALQNANYTDASTPQRTQFVNEVAAQTAAGNTIDVITMTLGFNELAALSLLPNGVDLIAPTLAAYRAAQRQNLTLIRSLAPNADLYLLGYYNPFPGDPTGANPATPIFAVGGPQLNAVIASLAAEFGAIFVDTAPLFLGREAELTFIDEVPAGGATPPPYSPSDSGLAPIGNVHATEQGYALIAAALAAASPVATPAPAAVALFGLGAGFLASRRRV